MAFDLYINRKNKPKTIWLFLMGVIRFYNFSGKTLCLFRQFSSSWGETYDCASWVGSVIWDEKMSAGWKSAKPFFFKIFPALAMCLWMRSVWGLVWAGEGSLYNFHWNDFSVLSKNLYAKSMNHFLTYSDCRCNLWKSDISIISSFLILFMLSLGTCW